MMKRKLCLIIVSLLAATVAFADIARPDKTPNRVKKPKGIATTMSIKLDRNATEATLIIPKTHIKQLRAELERLDDDNTAAVTENDFSRLQTIVSGMFLSLAFVFGGIWFVRKGKSQPNTAKTLVVVAGLAAFGSAATLVVANVGPPPEARTINSKMFSQAVHLYKQGSGKITLEASGDSDYVQLIVPDPQPSPAGE